MEPRGQGFGDGHSVVGLLAVDHQCTGAAQTGECGVGQRPGGVARQMDRTGDVALGKARRRARIGDDDIGASTQLRHRAGVEDRHGRAITFDGRREATHGQPRGTHSMHDRTEQRSCDEQNQRTPEAHSGNSCSTDRPRRRLLPLRPAERANWPDDRARSVAYIVAVRKPIESGDTQRIVDEETEVLARVQAHAQAGRRASVADGPRADYEADLVALRDQIAEEKPEDLASLVEQMTRVASLAAGRRGRAVIPIDVASPYFAHMRLRIDDKPEPQEVLIGRRGLIDRAAGVQIVDWRDAPISQVYYRYDEGDDYEEKVGGTTLKGIVEARRNVTIAVGRLRRIGCPRGTFVSSLDGRWFELSGQGVALLEGGARTAARPPRPTGPHPRRDRHVARPARTVQADKQLPEIAALIDRDQFALITEPGQGLVVVQGGAGSGKTTVALHRIAYLVFHEPAHFRPSKCLFVVPSDALARYVAGVLPALGVPGVPVTTFRSWARNLRARLVTSAPDRYAEETPLAVSRLKKHPRMGQLLVAQVQSERERIRVELLGRLTTDDERTRVDAAWQAAADLPPLGQLKRVRGKIERGELALSSGAQHSATQLLLAETAQLRDARRLVFELLTDRGRLAQLSQADVPEPATAGEIEELVRRASAQLDEAPLAESDGVADERMTPIDGRPLDEGGSDAEQVQGRLDVEDDALLLRAFQLVYGALTRVDKEPLLYDHIALDEAQDLSAVEIELLYAATTDARSMTIAGDVAQRVIFDNGFRGWDALLQDMGVPEKARALRPLTLAYRSTEPVMRFARAVLGPLAAEATDTEARPGAEVVLHGFDGMGEAVGFIGEALRSLVGREPSASVALIARHAGQADAWYAGLARAEVPSLRRVRRQEFVFAPGVDVTDVAQVKGLEFDYVILLDVNQGSYPDTIESRHLLHIGATRATHQLWLVATGAPSSLVESVMRGEGDVGSWNEAHEEDEGEPAPQTEARITDAPSGV